MEMSEYTVQITTHITPSSWDLDTQLGVYRSPFPDSDIHTVLLNYNESRTELRSIPAQYLVVAERNVEIKLIIDPLQLDVLVYTPTEELEMGAQAAKVEDAAIVPCEQVFFCAKVAPTALVSEVIDAYILWQKKNLGKFYTEKNNGHAEDEGRLQSTTCIVGIRGVSTPRDGHWLSNDELANSVDQVGETLLLAITSKTATCKKTSNDAANLSDAQEWRLILTCQCRNKRYPWKKLGFWVFIILVHSVIGYFIILSLYCANNEDAPICLQDDFLEHEDDGDYYYDDGYSNQDDEDDGLEYGDSSADYGDDY